MSTTDMALQHYVHARHGTTTLCPRGSGVVGIGENKVLWVGEQ